MIVNFTYARTGPARRAASGDHVPTTDSAKTRPPLVSSRDLLGGEALLRIEHNGEIYTLRITRNGRLILTK
jgi:hemin uptake protein HemP